MMYQRDIVVLLCLALCLTDEAQQIFDRGREESVDSEEEEREQQRHDEDHDPGRDGLLAGRPVDLGGLGADLPDEFAWGDFRHLPASSRVADRKSPRGPERPAGLAVT